MFWWHISFSLWVKGTKKTFDKLDLAKGLENSEHHKNIFITIQVFKKQNTQKKNWNTHCNTDHIAVYIPFFSFHLARNIRRHRVDRGLSTFNPQAKKICKTSHALTWQLCTWATTQWGKCDIMFCAMKHRSRAKASSLTVSLKPTWRACWLKKATLNWINCFWRARGSLCTRSAQWLRTKSRPRTGSATRGIDETSCLFVFYAAISEGNAPPSASSVLMYKADFCAGASWQKAGVLHARSRLPPQRPRELELPLKSQFFTCVLLFHSRSHRVSGYWKRKQRNRVDQRRMWKTVDGLRDPVWPPLHTHPSPPPTHEPRFRAPGESWRGDSVQTRTGEDSFHNGTVHNRKKKKRGKKADDDVG